MVKVGDVIEFLFDSSYVPSNTIRMGAVNEIRVYSWGINLCVEIAVGDSPVTWWMDSGCIRRILPDDEAIEWMLKNT